MKGAGGVLMGSRSRGGECAGGLWIGTAAAAVGVGVVVSTDMGLPAGFDVAGRGEA